MSEFEFSYNNDISLFDVTNKDLYNYDFSSLNIAPLQKSFELSSSNEIWKFINASNIMEKLLNASETEYVADLSKYMKDKISSGEWAFITKKYSNNMYASLKDKATGKIVSNVELTKISAQGLSELIMMYGVQAQLSEISYKIELLNKMVERIEYGQYDDRYSGFFAARQLVIEAISSSDEDLKKELIISSIKINNETISKLMLSLNREALTFTDGKTSKKEADKAREFLINLTSYLNSCIQLNLVSYSQLNEKKALMATLINYQSFIEQVMLRNNEEGKTVAWLIDNGGCPFEFEKTMESLNEKIDSTVGDIKILIGGNNYEIDKR